MPNIIFATIGISGSGKSTLADNLSKTISFKLICPDDIRKETTGNISDQSQNNKVFAIANKRLEQYIQKGNVFYSATNLSKEARKSIYKVAEVYKAKIIWLIMKDSWQPLVCEERVRNDLINFVDRSDTLKTVGDKTPLTVIGLQHLKFKACMQNIASEIRKYKAYALQVDSINTDIIVDFIINNNLIDWFKMKNEFLTLN